MSIKKTLLAAAIAAFAFTALPAIASAYYVEYEDPNFSMSSETITGLAIGEETFACAEVTGGGAFANPHEGSLKLVFHGCKLLGTNCTTSGSPTGTITTTTLPFEIVEVNHEEERNPGVLITPGAETNEKPHVMSFECVFGLVEYRVGGDGLIGTLEAPEVGKSSNTFTMSFDSDGEENQTHTTAADTTEQVDPENHYNLTASVNGGPTEPAAQIGNGLIHFESGEATVVDAGTE